MTERIDHSDIARGLMRAADGDDEGAGWDLADRQERWHISALISEAQVHASLALVEQQRIANRLKVAELDLHHEVEYKKMGGHALAFRIRPYLTPEDWEAIDVRNEDES